MTGCVAAKAPIMAGEDTELMAMVRRLAAMPPSDRAFVFASFDAQEASELDRLVRQADARAMSPLLQDVVSDCRNGSSGSGITVRAARAIEKAVASQVAEPVTRAKALPSASLMGRLAARLLGR